MSNNRTDLEIDLLGEKVEVTGKRMPNGEIRRRVRFSNGTSIHHTVAPLGHAKWQNAHFHKGLVEVQVVISGVMVVAEQGDNGRKFNFYSPDEVHVSVPGVMHNIYLYPGSVIATITYGEPIGDPKNKDNDWWPADDDFNEWSKREFPG